MKTKQQQHPHTSLWEEMKQHSLSAVVPASTQSDASEIVPHEFEITEEEVNLPDDGQPQPQQPNSPVLQNSPKPAQDD